MATTEGLSFQEYLQIVFKQFLREWLRFGRDQIVTALVLTLGTFFLQVHRGQISRPNITQNLTTLLYPYVFILVLLAIWKLVKVAWKLSSGQKVQLEKIQADNRAATDKTENAHRIEVNFLSEKIDQLKQELQSEKEKQAQPSIVPEIVEAHVGMNWGTTPWKFDCAIAIKLYLVNKSSPVTIKDYGLSIESPTAGNFSSDQRTIDLSYWRLCKEERVSQNGTRYIDRCLEPHLDSAIGKQILDRGQGREGWLLFLVEGVDVLDCRAATISVTVVDAFGGRHPSEKAQFSQPSALIERAA
jgi:hypothetical protein